MTTIAYKDGIIAYDSRATAGTGVVDDDCDKRIVDAGINFVLCGVWADFKYIRAAYFGEAFPDNVEASGFIYDDELHLISIEDGKVYSSEIELNKPYAIGSGADHAWTAMDMGATAKESIKMAIKRDTCSGGRIRSFKIR